MATGGPIAWKLLSVAHLFFLGISVGAFFLSTLPYVFHVKQYNPLGKLMLCTSLMTLLPALLLLVLSLSSMMTWVIWLYGAYTLILVGQVRLAIRERGVGRDRQVVRMLGIIGVVVTLPLLTGSGMIPGLFPMTFLVSTLLSGGALVVCLSPLVIKDGWALRETVSELAGLVGALLTFELLALLAEVLVALGSGIPSHIATIWMILAGPAPWIFWGLQIVAGALVPLLLLFRGPRVSLKASAIACFFILVGVFAFLLNGVNTQSSLMGRGTSGVA